VTDIDFIRVIVLEVVNHFSHHRDTTSIYQYFVIKKTSSASYYTRNLFQNVNCTLILSSKRKHVNISQHSSPDAQTPRYLRCLPPRDALKSEVSGLDALHRPEQVVEEGALIQQAVRQRSNLKDQSL
jgi:hypothetical protein